MDRSQAALLFLRQISQSTDIVHEKQLSIPQESPTIEQRLSAQTISRIYKRQDLDQSLTPLLSNLQQVPLVYCTPLGTPMMMMSIIGYKESKRLNKKRQKSKYSVNPYLERIGLTLPTMPTLNLETVRKKQDSSYVHLLEPQGLLQQAEYNPLYLDNPDLKAIRHKTIITLPFFLGSIIQPSKPDEIRKEIDEHFKETHPQVDPSVTLTQIRATKAKLLLDLELSSVAFSYVYLEKLILKGFVRESNMRLVGAVCLLLAAKINDPKDLEYKTLTAAMERILDLPRREVYSNEFSVYSALDFTLFLPLSVISPHLNRILSATDFKDIEGYFGPNEFYLNAPTPNVQSPN